MNIGNQIRALRLRRGVTQEAMAEHFGISAQAVSKWECGTSVSDIGILPELSAYFGVSIDTLFALDDETRIDRIQNMLWDMRYLNPADVENERQFLLEKAAREPENSDVHCMLAQIELHLAQEHQTRAEEYSLEILRRAPVDDSRFPGLTYLVKAMGGKRVDWRFTTHTRLIALLKEQVEKYPEEFSTYAFLIVQLVDDRRLEEAKHYCQQMETFYQGFHWMASRIRIALAENDLVVVKQLCNELLQQHPDDWSVVHEVGDFQAQAGDYTAAKESYRRAIEMLPKPRRVDAIDSLAQVCEIDGDIEGAIATRRFELEVSEKDWGDTTGETVDVIHREIARLQKLL